MKTHEEFPHDIIEAANIFMPDSICLAARTRRPKDAERKPVPGIIEYIPYRKRFGTTVPEEVMHR